MGSLLRSKYANTSEYSMKWQYLLFSEYCYPNLDIPTYRRRAHGR